MNTKCSVVLDENWVNISYTKKPQMLSRSYIDAIFFKIVIGWREYLYNWSLIWKQAFGTYLLKNAKKGRNMYNSYSK